MRVLAATGDTWGLSGPTFLWLYVALAVVTVLATVRSRRALTRNAAPASRLDNPYDIAYLHNGPELTVLAALSAMHAAGRITSSGRGRVQAIGAVGPDTGELERAIHLSTQQPVPRAKIPGAAPVAEALGRIERRLIDIGLLLSAEQRKRIRRTEWMLWAVVALGAIRTVAGYLAGEPIGLLLALLAVVAVGAAVFSRTTPQRTDRGDAELARLRITHPSLSPRLRPDRQVYGPAGAALGVAVFGASALSAADPTLAEELGVRTTSSAGDSGDGGSSDGGGGGGCGGGCGGCGG